MLGAVSRRFSEINNLKFRLINSTVPQTALGDLFFIAEEERKYQNESENR